MRSKFWLILLILALGGGLAVWVGFKTVAGQKVIREIGPALPWNDLLRRQRLARVKEPVIEANTPRRGPDTARIKMVEYSNFLCPACRESSDVISRILARYPGKIQHIWKDLPNETSHRGSTLAHMAARCAGEQGRFWEYHDALFASKEQFSARFYINLAGDLGLDQKLFEPCFLTRRPARTIENNVIEATALGVDAVPYLIIGQERISGLPTVPQLVAILSGMLE